MTGRPPAFVSQATDDGECEVAEEQEMTDSWADKQDVCGHVCLCVCTCLCPAGHTVDDRLARPRMGQAPSAAPAAVMCPFSLHHSQSRLSG